MSLAKKSFFVWILMMFGPGFHVGAADKVIISYGSRSYAFLPAQISVAKGFFKDENLEPLLIQMRSQVTVPALISGEVNYTSSFGNIIGSAMQGMPFKILGVLTDKPLHSVVGRPEIKTIRICAASASARNESAARIISPPKQSYRPKGSI